MQTLMQLMRQSTSTGNDRLVLFTMAACADWRGEVAISCRQISELTALAKSTVQRAVTRLIAAGELRVVARCDDSSSTYKYMIITGSQSRSRPDLRKPDAPDKPVPGKDISEPITVQKPAEQGACAPVVTIPDNLPRSDVGRILAAACVTPDGYRPLYWFRAEHKADVPRLCKAMGASTVDALIEMLLARRKTCEGLTGMKSLMGLAQVKEGSDDRLCHD